MPDALAPDAAQASEVAAEPQSAPPVDGANSTAAPDLADQAAQAPASEGVDAGSPTASVHGRKPADERIQELVADKKALRDAAEFWRERALSTQAPAPTPQASPTAEAAPTLEQFEFDSSRWAKAHAEWTDKQIESRTTAAVSQQLRQARVQDAQAAVEEQWSGRLAELAKADATAVDAITIAGRIVTPLMGQLIKESPVGPQIGRHLGLNPDKAARIARMPEAQQAVHIGRLEAEIGTAPAPVRKPISTTRAPAPPTPVGGNAPSKAIEAMTIDEYLEARATRRNLTRA